MKGRFLIVVVCGFLVSFSVFALLSKEAEGLQTQTKKIEKGQKIFSLKTPDVVRGWASWYGPGFQGKKMANGKRYDMRNVLVAHRSLPLGTKVKVMNLRNRKSVIAFVHDRGPNFSGRDLDLSWAAAKKIGALRDGVIPVEIEIRI
jgi:rare lipoprotein A